MRPRRAVAALLVLLTPAMVAGTGPPAAEEPPEPVVTVVGASASGLTVTSRDPSLAMQVQLQAGEVGATDVVLAASDLRSETGAVTPVTLEGNEVGAIGPGAVAAVDLTSELPEPGTWTGVLTITHDGIAEGAVVLVVTRTRSVSTVEVDPVGVAERVRHLCCDGLTQVLLTLHETAGQDVVLAPPRVVGLGRVDGDVTIQPRDPEAVVEYRVGDGAWVRADDSGLEVAGSSEVRLRVSLPGVNSPGTYTATVQTSEPGGTATATPVKVRIRYAWCFFALSIVVGLGLAHLAGVVLRRGRERSLLEARLREVVAGLPVPRPGDDEAVRLVTSLVDQEKALRDKAAQRRADWSALGTAAADLEARAAMVPVWMRVHRFVRSVEPAEVVEGERVSLAEIATKLGAPGLTAERASAVATQLVTLSERASTAVTTALRARLDGLVTLLDNQEPVLTPGGSARVPEIRTRLDEARAHLDALELAETTRVLVGAEHLLMSVLVDDVRHAAEHPPAWVSVPHTERIGRDVAKQLALTSGPRDRLAGAQHALVRDLIDAAREKLPTITDPDRREAVSTALTEAAEKLSNDVVGAREGLTRAVELAGGFPQQTRSDGPVPRTLWVPPEFAPAPILTTGDLRAEQVRARGDVKAAARRAARFGTASLLVAAVVALVVGTLVLYVTDPDWGTLADIATAVLWGLGIQATAGFSFQGLAGLRDNIERPAAPAAA